MPKKKAKKNAGNRSRVWVRDTTPAPPADFGLPPHDDDPYDGELYEILDDLLFDDDPPPISPRDSMELFQRIVQRLIDQRQLTDMDDINRMLQTELTGRHPEDLLPELEDSAAEVALLLTFQAKDAETDEEALDLVNRALALDPECIDALTMRLDLSDPTGSEQIDGLRQIVTRVEEVLKPDYLEDYPETGLWGLIDARPYMRVREQLLYALERAERLEEAIAEARAMLRLNPSDNQGIRDTLLRLFLAVKNPKGALELLDAFREDASAMFAWGHALALFQLEGSSPRANAALVQARRANRYVQQYFSGARELPDFPPAYYSPGSPQEASICFVALCIAWSETPGALEWILGKNPRGTRKRSLRGN